MCLNPRPFCIIFVYCNTSMASSKLIAILLSITNSFTINILSPIPWSSSQMWVNAAMEHYDATLWCFARFYSSIRFVNTQTNTDGCVDWTIWPTFGIGQPKGTFGQYDIAIGLDEFCARFVSDRLDLISLIYKENVSKMNWFVKSCTG